MKMAKLDAEEDDVNFGVKSGSSDFSNKLQAALQQVTSVVYFLQSAVQQTRQTCPTVFDMCVHISQDDFTSCTVGLESELSGNDVSGVRKTW